MISVVTPVAHRTRTRSLAPTLVALFLLLGASGSARAQTNPTAQALPYAQNFASLTPGTVTTLPAGWASWTLGTAASASYRTTAPTADKAVTANGSGSSTTGTVYNYLDKPGFLNSGSFDGSLALAINTTGLKDVAIGYDIMTLRNPFDGTTNTRISLSTLQYRVGTSGAFTTLNAASYFNNTTAQTSGTAGQNVQSRSFTLPADCNDQPNVQLRWVSRDSTGAGSRPSIALDNVSVTGTAFFTLTASAGANGSVSPSGAVDVNSGANQTFTITPNPNYHVADVLVDGVSQGPVPSFTFTNVNASHTLSATFAIDTYTITASAGVNGSIVPNGVTSVNATASQAYTITPNAGYIVQDVLVDAVSVGAVTGYTFTNVLANHTLGASFTPDPNATVNAGPPGTFVTTVASAAVPVTLSRGVGTPMLGYSVKLTLTGLTTTTGAFAEGGFLAASGGTTSFHVTDNGGGTYTVDAVTLGLPCGSSATSGTLFTVNVGSTLLAGTGTVTINSVTLRDCSNATLPSSVGSAASVDVDRSTPAVAVTAPNGGESWVQGTGHAITWTATDPEGVAANSVTLQYSLDNGASWLPVASGLANSGSFSWTVPGVPSATARVRVSALDVHANPASDASDAAFTIQGTTATSLASAPDPSRVGEGVTLTATVAPAAATGSVEFFDGATSLGTAPLAGGTASLNTASLPVGAHSLTAVYAGSALYAGSSSAVHSHTVDPAATTTSLASAPNPSLAGESVTLTATVVVTPPGAGIPGGSVEFFDGATSLGTAPVVAGAASLNTASLGVGAHSLTAVYAGNASFSGSMSAAQPHTVNPASTTTTLASAPNPSLAGESVALTAGVAVDAPGSGTATGSVEFFDGATSLGTAPLSGGSASLNTSALAVGSHGLTAVYAGNASFTGSTAAVHVHAVNQAATATSLTSAPNPSLFGQSVALNATVSVTPPGAGSPGGSVEFFDGATSLGTSPVVAGTASLNTSSLSVGPHSLTAVYPGDASFTGSTSAVHPQTVSQAGSTTSVASSLNPSTFGAGVTFTATVTPSGATGSVEFLDGATSLGSSPLVAGSAALSTSTLTAGSHAITAVYPGDTNHAGGTSGVLTQVVNAAGTSVALVASPSPGVSLDPETLTATVAPSGATGSVEFFDGATSLGTSALSAGSTQLVTSSLSVGAHSLTAVYSGDTNHSGATSSAVSLEIRARIVATSGANGSVTPSGTVLVSLGATPSFSFAADPGYHVASVTVDGAAAPTASPYTFAPVSSNHTLDVQFAANPAVAAITTLGSVQQRTGNDVDGTTKITLTWTPVPAGSTVEVWRKGYGNYPEYNSGASPGSEPTVPGSYPPAGWTLTAVANPGDTDEPATRDFWYYVAYVIDGFGTRSAVSNLPAGALDYHLGDISNGTTVGAGDNRVTTTDVSVLGLHYGLTGAAAAPYDFLDVGPTTDLSVTARPMPDGRINFEDLVMFAINYYPVASLPQARARPAAANADVVTLSAPTQAAVGEDIVVHLLFSGTGQMLALSTRLAWDPAVVEPVSWSAGDAVLGQGGLVFSAEPGTVDGASFAGTGQGLVGDGEFASLHFRVVAAGDPRFGFAKVDARDHRNHALPVSSGLLAVTPKTFVTAFAPAMPNPFSRTTAFQFSLARAGRAELELFSVDGRRVRTLSSGMRDAGEYRLEWNGSDDSGRPLAAGVYYARLLTAQGRFTRVVTFLK